MKNLFFSFAVLAMTVGSSFTANATPNYKDVVLSVSEVYVPDGLASNVNAYVIVSGMFPNSCYSWKDPLVSSPTPLIHEIKSMASVAQQMCLMVMIPYQKQVQLGKLDTGTHTLRFMNGDGTFFEKTLTIE